MFYISVLVFVFILTMWRTPPPLEQSISPAVWFTDVDLVVNSLSIHVCYSLDNQQSLFTFCRSDGFLLRRWEEVQRWLPSEHPQIPSSASSSSAPSSALSAQSAEWSE